MRPVSIETFIETVYADDGSPPSLATIRRRCAQTDDQGNPVIPGSFRDGKPWRIDLDTYYSEMERRIRGTNVEYLSANEKSIVDQLALSLAN
tara:strand:- start:9462 stop:9737 length:276 start_codon:yes stop_codon:yes gene_type:complete